MMNEHSSIGHSAYHKRRRRHHRRQTIIDQLEPHSTNSLHHNEQQPNDIKSLGIESYPRSKGPGEFRSDSLVRQSKHLYQTDPKQANQQQPQQQILATSIDASNEIASVDSQEEDLGPPRLTMLEAPPKPVPVQVDQNQYHHYHHHHHSNHDHNHHSSYLTSVLASSNSNIENFQHKPDNQFEQTNNSISSNNNTTKANQLAQSQHLGPNWQNNDRFTNQPAPGNAQNQQQQLLLTFLYGSSFLLLIILGITIYNWFFTKNKLSPIVGCGKFYRNRARGFHEETSFARGLSRFIKGPSRLRVNETVGASHGLTQRRSNNPTSDADDNTDDNDELELGSMVVATTDSAGPLCPKSRMVILRKGVAKSPLVVALKSASKPKITLATERMKKFIDEEAEEMRSNAKNFTAAAKTYQDENDLRSYLNRVAAFFLFVVCQMSQSIMNGKKESKNSLNQNNSTEASQDCLADVTCDPETSRASTNSSKKLETILEVADQHRDEQQQLQLDHHRELAKLLTTEQSTTNQNRLSPLLNHNNSSQHLAQSDAYSSVSAWSLFSSSSPIETFTGIPSVPGACNCILSINSAGHQHQASRCDHLVATFNGQPAERSKSQGNTPCDQEVVGSCPANPNRPLALLQTNSGCYVTTSARACCSASPTAMEQTQPRFVDQCGANNHNQTTHSQTQNQCQQQHQLQDQSQQQLHHNHNNNCRHQHDTIGGRLCTQHSSDHLLKSKCNNCIPCGGGQHAARLPQQPSYLKRNYENYYDDEQSDCYGSLTAASLAEIELGFQDPQHHRHHLRNLSFASKPNIGFGLQQQQQQQHQQHHYDNLHQQQQRLQQYHVTAPPPSPQLRYFHDATSWPGHDNCNCNSNLYSQQQQQQTKQAIAQHCANVDDELQTVAPMSILVQQPSQASRSPTPSPCQPATLGHASQATSETELSRTDNNNSPLIGQANSGSIHSQHQHHQQDRQHHQQLHPRRTSIAGDRISSRLVQSGLLGANSGLQHNHFLHRASIASSDGSQWLHTNCGQQLARSLGDQTSPEHHFMAGEPARLLALHHNHQQPQQLQQHLGCNPTAAARHYMDSALVQQGAVHCYLGGQPSECSSLASSLYDPASYYCGSSSNYTGSSGFVAQSFGKSTCSSSGGSSSGIGFSGSACTNAPSSASFIPDSQANWNFENLSMSALGSHLANNQFACPGQQFSQDLQQQHHFCTLQYRHGHNHQQQQQQRQQQQQHHHQQQQLLNNEMNRYNQNQPMMAPSYGFNQAFASCAAQPMLMMMSHGCDPRRLPGGQLEAPSSGQLCCSSRKFSLPTQLESQAAERYSKSDNQAQTAELLFKQNRLPSCTLGETKSLARDQQLPQQQQQQQQQQASLQFESTAKPLAQKQQQQQQEENSESRRSSQTITRQSSFWLDEDNNSMGSLSSLTNAVLNLQADDVLQNNSEMTPVDGHQHLLSTESSIDSIKLRPSNEQAQQTADLTADADADADGDVVDGDVDGDGGCGQGGASDLGPANLANKDRPQARERRAGSERSGYTSNPRRFRHRLSSSSTNSSTGSSPSPDFGRPSERVLALAPKSGSISKRHLFGRFRARQQARNLSLAHSEPSTSMSTALERQVSAQMQSQEASCSTPSTPTAATKDEAKFKQLDREQAARPTSGNTTKLSQDTPTDVTNSRAGNSCEQDDVDGDFPNVFPPRAIPDLNSASLERQCRDLWKLRATLHDDNCAGDDWANYHQRLNRRYDSGYKSIEDQMSYSLEGGSFGIPPLALVNQLQSSRQNSDESNTSAPDAKPATSRPPSGCSGFINPELALNRDSQVTRELSMSPVEIGGDDYKEGNAN